MKLSLVLLAIMPLALTTALPGQQPKLAIDQRLPTLEDDLKAFAAGAGWWEQTGNDKSSPTIKLFYLKAGKDLVAGQLIVWGSSTAQAGFTFRLSEKDKKRFITGGGAAFSEKNAENVFSYQFVDGKLVIEGGVAHSSTTGTVRLKGEWKWVVDKYASQKKTAEIPIADRVKKLESENEALKQELAKLKQELADLKAQLAPPNVDTMDTVYKSMKLTTMKVVGGPFKPGDSITVQYGLKNILERDIRLPVDKQGAAGSLGTRQHWIERLGKDADIPAIPAQTARMGRRYAASGYSIYSEPTLKPGQILPFERTVATKEFPPGTYRYYVEYSDSKGKFLQSESVEFELVGK